MAHDVFISYSSKKKNVALKVRAALEAQGIACWMAPESISLASLYTDSLMEAVQESKIILVVFCTQANQSIWVKSEIERGVNYQKRIIVFRIEDTLPTGGMEMMLSGTQWFDGFKPPLEKHLGILTERINRILNRNPPAPERKPPTPEPAQPTTEARSRIISRGNSRAMQGMGWFLIVLFVLFVTIICLPPFLPPPWQGMLVLAGDLILGVFFIWLGRRRSK